MQCTMQCTSQVARWGYLVLDEAHRLKNKDGKALAYIVHRCSITNCIITQCLT